MFGFLSSVRTTNVMSGVLFLLKIGRAIPDLKSQIERASSEMVLKAGPCHDLGDEVNCQPTGKAHAETDNEPHYPVCILRDEGDHGKNHPKEEAEEVHGKEHPQLRQDWNSNGLHVHAQVRVAHVRHHHTGNVRPTEVSIKHKAEKCAEDLRMGTDRVQRLAAELGGKPKMCFVWFCLSSFCLPCEA